MYVRENWHVGLYMIGHTEVCQQSTAGNIQRCFEIREAILYDHVTTSQCHSLSHKLRSSFDVIYLSVDLATSIAGRL